MNKEEFVSLQHMVTMANKEFLLDNPQSKTEIGLHLDMRSEGIMADGVSIDQPSTSKRIIFHVHDNHPGIVGYVAGYTDRDNNADVKTVDCNNISISFIKELMSGHF